MMEDKIQRIIHKLTDCDGHPFPDIFQIKEACKELVDLKELVKKLTIPDVGLSCPFCDSKECQIIEAVSECYCDDCEKGFTA